MNPKVSKQFEAMCPSENVQLSEPFPAILKPFSTVVGSFWIVFENFFASFQRRRRRRRDVVFGIIVSQSIKKDFLFFCLIEKLLIL